MRKTLFLTAAALSLAALSAGSQAAIKSDARTSAIVATPPGVTIQQARLNDGAGGRGRGAAMGGGGAAATVFADAKGMTLYTFDKDFPGKSACYGECATAWPPLLAPANVTASGDWSVIARDDGAKQWAFEGKPLYTFSKDANLGDAKGNKAMDIWHAAVFEPAKGLKMPEGVKIDELVNAPGQALVTTKGMTLYALDGETPTKAACVGQCTDTWEPFQAPEIANNVGDFTIVKRADGIRQWAFKARPLYIFSGDYEPGDVNGENVDKKWHTALIARYFTPANVVITQSARHGAMFATADGMTLYARDANKFSGGGATHADRSVARGNPATGRAIGLAGCDDACTQTWKPFKAPADAQASGSWQIVTRADGTRQWAYLGFPLYTYTQDQPGSARGHDIYDLDGKLPSSGEAAQTAGAQALYWRVALP